jgi:hypothetical protein
MPITEEQRDTLAQTIAAKNPQVQQLTSTQKLPTLNQQCRFLRAAVRLALLDLGLLTINLRSITPPFILKKRAKIS